MLDFDTCAFREQFKRSRKNSPQSAGEVHSTKPPHLLLSKFCAAGRTAGRRGSQRSQEEAGSAGSEGGRSRSADQEAGGPSFAIGELLLPRAVDLELAC